MHAVYCTPFPGRGARTRLNQRLLQGSLQGNFENSNECIRMEKYPLNLDSGTVKQMMQTQNYQVYQDSSYQIYSNFLERLGLFKPILPNTDNFSYYALV